MLFTPADPKTFEEVVCLRDERSKWLPIIALCLFYLFYILGKCWRYCFNVMDVCFFKLLRSLFIYETKRAEMCSNYVYVLFFVSYHRCLLTVVCFSILKSIYETKRLTWVTFFCILIFVSPFYIYININKHVTTTQFICR